MQKAEMNATLILSELIETPQACKVNRKSSAMCLTCACTDTSNVCRPPRMQTQWQAWTLCGSSMDPQLLTVTYGPGQTEQSMLRPLM